MKLLGQALGGLLILPLLPFLLLAGLFRHYRGVPCLDWVLGPDRRCARPVLWARRLWRYVRRK